MKFLCPNCKAKYQIGPEKLVGRQVAKIRCRKQLPDFATVWITARRGTKTHTVDAQLGCSARFDGALGALRSVSRVKAP